MRDVKAWKAGGSDMDGWMGLHLSRKQRIRKEFGKLGSKTS